MRRDPDSEAPLRNSEIVIWKEMNVNLPTVYPPTSSPIRGIFIFVSGYKIKSCALIAPDIQYELRSVRCE